MSEIFKAFQKKKDAIRRTIGSIRSNPADIEELTQEVFLKAFAAELKHDIYKPEHFLLRTAKNLAIKSAQRKVNSTTKSIEGFGGVAVFEDKQQCNQEDYVDARQKLSVVSKAIASLSPEVRRAFLMRRVDGLKFKQIATRMNVSTSTIEKRVANAMIDCILYLRDNGYDPAEFGAVLVNEPKPKKKNLGMVVTSKETERRDK